MTARLACEVFQDRRVVLLAYGDPYVPNREHGAWVFARRAYPCPECRPQAYAARCAELGETEDAATCGGTVARKG